MDLVLALKLVVVPLLIWGVTWAGHRWGPGVAGWLSAFPIFTAPILFIMALEQGPAFTASAAVGTMGSVASSVLFGLCYAWGATRGPWPLGLAAGYAGYFAGVAALTWWGPSIEATVVTVASTLVMAPWLYPRVDERAYPAPVRIPTSSDLPWRMGLGLVIVLMVTHFSAVLGPRLSGALSMFPILATVLVVFTQRRSGVTPSVRLLRGMVLGYYSFATFCLVLSLAIVPLGMGLGFVAALAAAAAVQALSRRRLQAHPSTPEPTTLVP